MTQKQVKVLDRWELQYDELTAFLIFYHIMQMKGYKRMFDKQLSMQKQIASNCTNILIREYPRLKIEPDIFFIFLSNLFCFGVYRLKDGYPDLLINLFDQMLLNCEFAIYRIIRKILDIKQEKLISLQKKD